MGRWPADNQSALLRFYGTPGPDVERQLVPVIPPFQMYYDGKPVRQIRFHRKAAPALAAALKEIWDHYGHDQRKIDALGISKYAGAYNPRFIRGSTTKWSNHAYGAAIDLNAEDNGFGEGKGTIPQPVVDAFKRQGARWGGDYRGRTDPMHFEFCDAGQAAPPAYEPATFVDEPVADTAEPEPDDTQPHASPAGSSKTGITESAVGAGGLSLAGIASQVWDAVSQAPDSIMRAMITLAQKPAFLVAVAVLLVVGFIWWRRRNMKKA